MRLITHHPLLGLPVLSKGKSKVIKSPYVIESPVVFECKTTQILQLQAGNGQKCDTWVVFGEVVGVHISETSIQDGVYQTLINRPIMRGGGAGDYYSISEQQKFEMLRP